MALERQRVAEEALLRAEEARRLAEQAAAAAQAGPGPTAPAAPPAPDDAAADPARSPCARGAGVTRSRREGAARRR
ncbi:hypothetical protein [Streptomyces nigra]|uniref:hypothetical protein n=1 Tax=Streptomyces nigra TaxID=1827580 RepID=UPI0035DE37E8